MATSRMEESNQMKWLRRQPASHDLVYGTSEIQIILQFQWKLYVMPNWQSN